MDPLNRHPMLLAPGSAASIPARCPGPDRGWPALDDHLVEPEVSRDEYIRGRKIQAMPANPPHADQQSRLDYLLNAHVKRGYVVSTELLTRVNLGSNFATDLCVRRQGVDPRTDMRYLEELAFEVVSEQSLKDISEKAEDMIARGVRRVLAIFVKTGEVKEWKGAWVTVEQEISDPLLEYPLSVQGLPDAAASHDAVARALIAQGNPVLRELRQEGHKEGHKEGLDEGKREGLAEGQRQALLTLLLARGFSISPQVRAHIASCADLSTLGSWIARAVTVGALSDLFPDCG